MRVLATARDSFKISHLQMLSQVTLLKLDPTSAPSVQAAVEAVKQETGGTFDFVNNAG